MYDLFNIGPDNAHIGKSTGPQSMMDKNSGGPMKAHIEVIQLSDKKFPSGSLLWGISI